MTDAELLKYQADLGNDILEKVNAKILDGTRNADPVSRALDSLVRRITNSGSTLMHLIDAPHDWSCDGASIVRTIYDASLQVLYILHDEAKQVELAQRFLDFSVVEKTKFLKLYDKGLTDLSKKISQSTKRAAAEAQIQAELERVSKLYGYNKEAMLKQAHWYKGNLGTLAKTVGYEAEYEILQKQLSGLVHSSYLTLEQLPRYKGHHILSHYFRFSFRVLDKVTEYLDVNLTDEERQLLDYSRGSVLDRPT